MPTSESGFFVTPSVEAFGDAVSGITQIYESQSGFFQIFAARHLGKKVILKTLKSCHAADPLALTQLRKEFALGFLVNSPYVAATLGIITSGEGIPAIELEFCDGQNLRRIIDSDIKLSDAQFRTIIFDLLKALSDIHEVGVIHRDIKPENLIFSQSANSLKVIDFGCAHALDYIALGGPAGTPAYTPPKKCHPDSSPEISDDLFAAGMVILELLPCLDKKSRNRNRFLKFGKWLTAGKVNSDQEAFEKFEKIVAPRSAKKTAAVVGLAAIAVITGITALIFFLSPHEQSNEFVAASLPADSISNNHDISAGQVMLTPDNHPALSSPEPAKDRLAGSTHTDTIYTFPGILPDSAPANASDKQLIMLAKWPGKLFENADSPEASFLIKSDTFILHQADNIYRENAYSILLAEKRKNTLTYNRCTQITDSISLAFINKVMSLHKQQFGKFPDKHRLETLLKTRMRHQARYNMGV